MYRLWAERVKLKRSKIVWIAVFSAIMVTFIVFMQGQFQYYGKRYVDEVTWYMTATQLLGTLFVVTFSVEAFLHGSLLDVGMAIHFAKLYLLEGVSLFLAVSLIVAIVYRLKKGYWLALIFAEIYSFLGLRRFISVTFTGIG